jgi:MerR family transcriptional regulator/heat shock protein HspR
MIGVAAELCGVHPQTLRQYERLGLIKPARVGSRNRLFSEHDIDRIRRIQRLTKDLGVNLAGVEVVLKLLDEMEELRMDFEQQFNEYVREAEVRMQAYMANSKAPIRRDEPLLPVPRIKVRRMTKL